MTHELFNNFNRCRKPFPVLFCINDGCFFFFFALAAKLKLFCDPNNMARQTERCLNTLDLSHKSIWQRTHSKALKGGGNTWNVASRFFRLSRWIRPKWFAIASLRWMPQRDGFAAATWRVCFAWRRNREHSLKLQISKIPVSPVSHQSLGTSWRAKGPARWRL